MNQGNPEVRPTTKVHEDRTKEEGNTAGTPNNCTAATKPSRNTTSSPHTHRTKAPENSKTQEHQRAKPDRQTAGAQQPSKDGQTDQPVSFTFQKKKEKKKKKRKTKTTKSPWNRLIIMNMCRFAGRLRALRYSFLDS